ncbi:SSV1 integrase-like protein, N-fragment [Thermococcus gammatolerans EJ3]|uniref:SSV1 integrase-like protein, N-fragment n=1 Tax=Thermococcus gammatolerans (strain DSM 15229 / JCM 11827 / EJ3) TaxID=593117 RepID=C5A3K5_THEGJ|nr:SSV1 integrase-like protein, N-fragment [Thermococcus gammatolerans EJ3]
MVKLRLREVCNWWARGDSNPGPPPCKGGVITV